MEVNFFHDHIVCEHPLPLPEKEEELKSMDWEDFHFVCDKIGSCTDDMYEYQIADNGFIYKKEENGISQQELTCEIKFFGIRSGEKCDYSLEFSSLFFKGELKELSLTEIKRLTSEEVEDYEKFKAESEEFNLSKSGSDSLEWYNVYLIRPLKIIVSFPLYLLFTVIHYIGLFLLKLLMRLK